MATDWQTEVIEQLTFWWDLWFWPRVQGLTDEEYLWEPSPPGWNVRPHPDGGHTIDWGPAPDPPPVTSIAWRLCHIGSGIFAVRNANHFGGPAWDMTGRDWPGKAGEALAWVAAGKDRWVQGAGKLTAEQLARPSGPAEGPYGHLPMSSLLLHINREVLHHGAEVCLLRDLWRARSPGSPEPG